MQKLKISAPDSAQVVKFLSGGNQQKVVLAKWIGMNLNVFIFDEPTRGIDIGAKEEIRNLIRGLAREKKKVILISSEIPDPGNVESDEHVIDIFKEIILVQHNIVLRYKVRCRTGEDLEHVGCCNDFITKSKIIFRRICEFAPFLDPVDFQGHIAIDDERRLLGEFDPAYEMQGDLIMFH